MHNLYAGRRPAGPCSTRTFVPFGLFLLLMLGAANAAPLHWQLNGVTFSDGARAFGGFDFDANTGIYSNINMTTTPSNLVAGSFYSTVAVYPGSATNSALNVVSTTPIFSGTTTALALGFSAQLSGAGGTVSLVGTVQESICSNANCSSVTSQRTITGGTVSAISTSNPKRWYFQSVAFSDGGSIFGSFIFDAASGTYSSISVTTTRGGITQGASYFTKGPAASSNSSVSLISSSSVVAGSTTILLLNFSVGLTNAGGTIAIGGVSEATCSVADCSTSAQLRNTAVPGIVSTDQGTEVNRILPQIADGGGFVTVFILTNPSGATVTCRLTFWQDNGTLLPLSLNGAPASPTYVVAVAGHSTQFLSTPGLGPSVAGWALADHVGRLGVVAAYHLKLANLPESEATVEAVDATAGFAMAFDETPGYDTGFALANVSAYDTVIENLYFYDTNGTLIFSDSTHTLAPHQHEAFFFSSRYKAQLQGKRGTVRVYYGTVGTPAYGAVGLTGLGLRVNPGNTFTSLPASRIE